MSLASCSGEADSAYFPINPSRVKRLETRLFLWFLGAIVFALLAVATTIFVAPLRQAGGGEHFAFLRSTAAMSILGSYIAAYALLLEGPTQAPRQEIRPERPAPGHTERR